MAILLTLFIVVGLPAGWFDNFWTEPPGFHVMVWGCILTATVAGVGVEWLVARAGAPRRQSDDMALRRVGAVWALATAVSAVLFVLLLTPLFDPLGVIPLVVLLVIVEAAGVTVAAAALESRETGRFVRLNLVGRFAVLNIASMIAGVVAGRLFLFIFYPDVG